MGHPKWVWLSSRLFATLFIATFSFSLEVLEDRFANVGLGFASFSGSRIARGGNAAHGAWDQGLTLAAINYIASESFRAGYLSYA